MSEQVQAAPQKKRRNSRRVKRMVKRIVKWIFWLCVLAAAALFGYRYYREQTATQTASTQPTYATSSVQSGAISKTVYGTGMIEAASQPVVSIQTDGTLSELRVDIGDEVKEGDVLAVLENDELDATIQDLEYALWELDDEIMGTSPGATVVTVRSPIAGRVMKLYGQVGDDALAVYRKYGAVALLSTDGRMKVEFDVAEGTSVELGETLFVSGMGAVVGTTFSVEGEVTDLYMQGTKAVVTINDDTLPMDADATVTNGMGEIVGTGTLEINKPMAVSAYGGTIRQIRVNVGDEIERKDTIYVLEDSPLTLTQESLRIQREAAAEELEEAKEQRENLIILAPCDGVIASVEALEVGSSVTAGTTLLSILEGEDMTLTIAVDELDVVSVQEGQPVSITVDALSDLTVEGTVEKIAPVGSGESGVTTYDVKLSFDAAGTGIRAGMNATGEILVASVEDALYIPVEALMTVNDQYCVLTASGSYQPVETGIMNDEYVQILSGLEAGDLVCYESDASSSSATSMDMGGMVVVDMGGMTGAPSGGMPSGGMPSGDMPSGGMGGGRGAR
ncbi:MAG TPA: efflux RND transporter periplasmic adaptor subunit [Candidatus Onthenecus intestinigallinarum]|uniref:Efflux RND transporter periplasmic adaptor subunit n=1 Tax=Candidatus Onthenecus intestinigallinarum TaxID=2840875 RepID=A0A9D0ZB93_9FIRM|nr:efflux RND transporter periplasmic adaptor subunit [Candidatus Onthenecus intestinigallinarum]